MILTQILNPSHLVERMKRAIFYCLLCFGRSPKYEIRLAELRLKHDSDLSEVAQATGIRLETLTQQRDAGLDNPAYRFHRDRALLSYIVSHVDELRGCSWLDVGAGTGAVSVYFSEILKSSAFELCDVNVATRTNFPVRQIDGMTLDYGRNSFDLVLFSYVLHHAGDNAIPLLRDAHRITRKLVIVAEDPKETLSDCVWAYQDDKRGTFRGRKEWLELFSMLGFSVAHEHPLDCQGHSRHLFVLAPHKEPL
jgi:SAM-dependent methyltransferase